MKWFLWCVYIGSALVLFWDLSDSGSDGWDDFGLWLAVAVWPVLLFGWLVVGAYMRLRHGRDWDVS